MLDDRHCPACGSGKPGRSRSAVDHREGVPGTFSLVICTDCGSARTVPVPEDIGAAYPQTYQQHNAATTTQRVVAWGISRTATAAGARARGLRRLLPDADLGGGVRVGARLLDVGAGNGTAVGAFRRAGVEAFGVEPSADAVRAAHEQGVPWVEAGTLADSSLSGETWDVIRLFHVLEHLPDPRVELRIAAAQLAPGGRLVIAVPNFGGFGSRAFRSSWDGLEVPRHLMHYTRRGLTGLLEDSGFTVTRVTTTPLFGLLPGSIDAATAGGVRQRGWGNRLSVRALSYPIEVGLAVTGLGDGLVAVAGPRR